MSQEAGKPKPGSAAPRGNPVGWAVGSSLAGERSISKREGRGSGSTTGMRAESRQAVRLPTGTH